MYEGLHSIVFETIGTGETESRHTWEDWFLIPTSRPTMRLPGAQNRFVDIPGMNGSYDLSDYLTSDVTYSDRSGSFEFVVDNDHADWLTIYREIATFLHGQRLRMILTDDPTWYYEGRFTLDEWKSEKTNSQISISYRVAPFKYSTYADYAENVLWDPFCFERDMDYSLFWHVQVSGSAKTLDVESYGAKNALIVRGVSGSVTASFGGITATVNTAGQEKALGDGPRVGKSTLTLTGNGTVDVGWRKLSL
jgi:hypothetical protein